MKLFLIPVAGALLGLFTSQGFAQFSNPFPGRGMKDADSAPPAWFGSKAAPAEESAGSPSWFAGQGTTMRAARANEMEDRPRLFGPWFKRPESSEPSLMQRANDRTRDWWYRTRDWASERNDALRNRTSEGWNNLKRGLRPGAEPDSNQMTTPYPRTTDAPDELYETRPDRY